MIGWRKLIIVIVEGVMLSSSGFAAENNTDRQGSDYKNFDLPQARWQLCEAACVEDTKCVAFTYVKPGMQGTQARCWLKTSATGATSNACCISGVKGVSDSIPMEYGTDRAGSDYTNFLLPEARPELCQAACLKDSRCNAFTYVKPGAQAPQPKCWLKEKTPNPTANAACVSGVLKARKDLEEQTDRQGSDYKKFELSENAPVWTCIKACVEEGARCKAITYVAAGVQGALPVCWLKDAVPKPIISPACTSWVK